MDEFDLSMEHNNKYIWKFCKYTVFRMDMQVSASNFHRSMVNLINWEWVGKESYRASVIACDIKVQKISKYLWEVDRD